MASIAHPSWPVSAKRDRTRSDAARADSIARRRARAEHYASPQLDVAKLEAELHADRAVAK